MNIVQSNSNNVIINGKQIPLENGMGNNVTIINNQVFVDGKEYVNGEWKRTFTALWHKFF